MDRSHLRVASASCAAVVAWATLVACAPGDEAEGGTSFTDCGAEIDFRGVTYASREPGGAQLDGLPRHPARGRLLGRADYCSPDPGEQQDVRRVFAIKDLPTGRGVFVQGFGPMVPAPSQK